MRFFLLNKSIKPMFLERAKSMTTRRMIKYAPLLLVITLLLLYAVRPGSRHDEYEIRNVVSVYLICFALLLIISVQH